MMKAWRAFKNILPQFLGVITLVGIMLAVLNPYTISKMIGDTSGWQGVFVSSVFGSITLIPGFVAFSTSAMLLKNGAGYMQIGAFISTLMMVGVLTYPIFLGSAAAGPLYGAFPVATVLLKKGAKFTNILIFLGAWSTTKVPMFLFEMSALSTKFAFTRLAIDIPGIIIIAYIVDGFLNPQEMELIRENCNSF